MIKKQFNKYTQFYDLLYRSKDYPSEVEFIDKTIKKFAKFKVKKILSLGCGTCSHDILLAKNGYSITGVDQSKSMLDIAKEKIKNYHLEGKISLICADITKMDIKVQHSAAMAMFNVIGYQISNKDINAVLVNTNKALIKGGLLFFDCWYMPAVLTDKPTDRIKEIPINKSKKIIRITKSHLNSNKNIIDINFHVMEISGKTIINEANETHSMRYWSIPEIETILDKNGFDLVKVYNYMEIDSVPSDKDWNIFVIAKKR